MNVLEVDATQYMLEVLASTQLARVVTLLPGTLDQLVLQVVRTGGPNDHFVVDSPIFVLHAFAPKEPNGAKAANMLLYRAFTALLAAVGQVVPVDGGRAVMTRLDLVSGPSPAPYENPNVRHAVSTIQARIKAA